MMLTNTDKGMATVRLSGMELLRIVAMFLVLVVHSCFFSLGSPTGAEVTTQPLSSATRVFFESLSIGCVNIFVLLSGWFGIRPKLVSISKFLFQCLFFLVGIYVICVVTGLAPLNLNGIAGCFLLLKWNWFIKAYLLLYILSPVINSYIDTAPRKQYRMILLFFFFFQSFYSWLSDAAVFFEMGYSTISFIGLYMLARYIAVYKPALFNQRKWYYLAFFIFSVILMAIFYYMAAYFQASLHIGVPNARIFRYDQPLVILSALSLVVYFSKLTFRSKIINWVAASSFAVFLLHTNPNICEPYFVPAIKFLYTNFDGLACLSMVFVFLVIVFVVAVGIDQFRILLWKIVEPYWISLWKKAEPYLMR